MIDLERRAEKASTHRGGDFGPPLDGDRPAPVGVMATSTGDLDDEENS
ncbi:hypothetical protein [Cellulomonas xiejunii]|uniref:Uncharacterized protein n=1 Tax=Cellulomonas xiejunii TaxID=2968083 RepID=A0ABY5KMT4_9CELL|nr:hypothetical protein [Cellulomonas xiejunii]MCC2321230.1 hypothetical protein [Cellulomonas xiejunii]UUI71817.1 hypothetical protein NP048_18855 [Cellulomonas xiejunii]